jgi:hypothetical protein
MMKLNFLKYKTKSLLKKNKSPRANPTYKHAKTVGLLFTVEDKQKHFIVKEFIKKLEHDGKIIQVLEYLPDKHDNYEFKFDFFSDKDVSFWGNITSSSALQFSEAPFDFLFYIDQIPNDFVLHLLARSKAKCRVGPLFDDGEKYLELMISQTANTQALVDGMYRYTTLLR